MSGLLKGGLVSSWHGKPPKGVEGPRTFFFGCRMGGLSSSMAFNRRENLLMAGLDLATLGNASRHGSCYVDLG